ncbi:transglutaminase-like cysteine peptidase [Pseudohaliea rubra]|uniref:Putative transglutaminase n=1 Tax=Pseudohaliea rubra DSM 19751 TaxID=1265313 RepID=A0A095VS74_9GAMM|nr:transglutaminase-like cysteine peptidase [Pseudohaliea rubra]KGE03943.1 putative transglutaminase [Pseudohaliea rubra DSM 19751]
MIRRSWSGRGVAALLLLLAALLAESRFANREQLLATARERYGSDTAARVAQWQDALEALAGKPVADQLDGVNRFFNVQLTWRDDQTIWGQEDYWATPMEAFSRGAADCEDFSIAKYVSLLELGVPVEALRITYVRARPVGGGSPQAHMVLAYYPRPGADPLILDNLAAYVLPASRRTDLTPVFGFNTAGIWVGDKAAPASRNPTARLSRWRDLLRRMQEEGLH